MMPPLPTPPRPTTLDDARTILDGHRYNEMSRDYLRADRLAEALAIALDRIDALEGKEAAPHG